ncbi:TonB-dependent receptor [Novosphingobium flavum]|uniref:TonB-dependent receptor n=1 Tax=Novosphingobium aerophilum TaxID=2839843 RepID=A0A7X1F665_9SPHN|nr:TonB-dependent receptor [Novosphingobium aerophilum]MBC2660694.1 TonB-dependent receptor [Novosphingobium aerophilum]
MAYRRTGIGLLAGVCSLAVAASAFAQTQPQGAAGSGNDANENEIVVTAQNRSQNVQDVPIAIDVVNAEALKKTGFGGLNDIDKIAPVVQLNQDQGTVKISVRGVGTATNDESQDTSVVVNIDGEYMNRPDAMSVALFDMERVEVLRGPQGTLYGRNSTGGAINFITRKAGNTLGANASASYGNYNAVRLDGGVDLPLGDVAAVRVAGFYDSHDGYVSHPARPAFNGGGFNYPAFAGGKSDDNKSYGGRISLKLTPGERLTANVSAEFARRDFTPQAFAAADLNVAGNGPTGGACNNGFTRVAPAYPQVLCVPNNTNLLSKIDRSTYLPPNFGLGKLGQETWAIRGRLAYELGDSATLTYTGGYRNFKGDPGTFLTLPYTYRSFSWNRETNTQSHELRLNGTAGALTYQFGGFYFQESVNNESAFVTTFGPNVVQLSYFGRYVNSNSKSLFGQVEYAFTDKLTAVGGLRYTKNERTGIYRNASPFGAGPPDPLLFNGPIQRQNFSALRFGSTLNLDSSEDRVTWLAGLNYKPDADTLIYGKVSTGFKGGGFDSVGDYKPETNTAYEAGLKKNFGEYGQHVFNLTGFYYDYKDLQVSVLLDTRLGGQTFNAGKAKIWGIEATTDLKLDDNTGFHASVNYLNAQYKDLKAQFNVYAVPGTGPDINGVGDLDPNTAGVQQPNFAGNRPGFSPEWIITAGLDHTIDLGAAGSLTGRVNTTFKSSYFTDFYNYRDGQQKAFTNTELNLEYRPENKRFSIQGFVKNLENNRPLTYGSFISAGPVDDVFNWQFGTPRTYGVRLSADF